MKGKCLSSLSAVSSNVHGRWTLSMTRRLNIISFPEGRSSSSLWKQVMQVHPAAKQTDTLSRNNSTNWARPCECGDEKEPGVHAPSCQTGCAQWHLQECASRIRLPIHRSWLPSTPSRSVRGEPCLAHHPSAQPRNTVTVKWCVCVVCLACTCCVAWIEPNMDTQARPVFLQCWSGEKNCVLPLMSLQVTVIEVTSPCWWLNCRKTWKKGCCIIYQTN